MDSDSLSGEDASGAWKRNRQVLFDEQDGFVDTPCYESERLRHGNVIVGPAIIEAAKTTVVIPRAYRLQVDAYGNYKMRRC